MLNRSEAMGNDLEELGQTGNGMWLMSDTQDCDFPSVSPWLVTESDSHTLTEVWHQHRNNNNLAYGWVNMRNKARKRYTEINALKKRGEIRWDKTRWKHIKGSVWYNVSRQNTHTYSHTVYSYRKGCNNTYDYYDIEFSHFAQFVVTIL